MKRIEISLNSHFNTETDIPALQAMEKEFKDFVWDALESDPEAEIEAVFNFAGKNKMDVQWMGELEQYSRLARCWRAKIPTQEEHPNMSRAQFQQYVDFRRRFVGRIEMGDNENQRRMILEQRKEPDEGQPLVKTDPRLQKMDYGV